MIDAVVLQTGAEAFQQTWPFVGKSAADELAVGGFFWVLYRLGRPAVMGHYLDQAEGETDAPDPDVYDDQLAGYIPQAWLLAGVALTSLAVFLVGGVILATLWAGVSCLLWGLIALWAYRRRRSQRDVDILRRVL